MDTSAMRSRCGAPRHAAPRSAPAFAATSISGTVRPPQPRCPGATAAPPRALVAAPPPPVADGAASRRLRPLRAASDSASAAAGGATLEGAAGEQPLWTPDQLYAQGAARLRALMDALPELTEPEPEAGGSGGGSGDGGVPVLAALLDSTPALVEAEPAVVRGALESLGAALGVSLVRAARLVARVPAVWERPPEEAAAKVRLASLRRCPAPPCLCKAARRPAAVSASTGVPVPSLLRLLGRSLGLVAVPTELLAAALEGLADDLGVAPEHVAEMLATQPTILCAQDSLVEAWAARLELPPDAVRALLSAQPGLLELTPTTVKARLESLAALFGVPLPLAAQLVLKHAALGAVPPNATITRAKNVSMALGISMQGAAGIIAKEPAFLAVLARCSGELRGTPVPDDVGEVGAAYEFYTMDWLQRQLREMAPGRVTSFASLDR
ncbi:hypothetical protein GPECTOR_33g556 [Gonium pectorale]|uniref:Uncharacterized protein n=1 Tax=Gonium pectorale TaxID=33097 RepID=A0A150GCV5_GONPE|nr:hypothetical protein GPECTOR_33g556 [Gonium pectorale]|eukprot:KXZ47674.1 hypothetical protein GPECTOR_33g556 [Gonium pectorale]